MSFRMFTRRILLMVMITTMFVCVSACCSDGSVPLLKSNNNSANTDTVFAGNLADLTKAECSEIMTVHTDTSLVYHRMQDSLAIGGRLVWVTNVLFIIPAPLLWCATVYS